MLILSDNKCKTDIDLLDTKLHQTNMSIWSWWSEIQTITMTLSIIQRKIVFSVRKLVNFKIWTCRITSMEAFLMLLLVIMIREVQLSKRLLNHILRPSSSSMSSPSSKSFRKCAWSFSLFLFCYAPTVTIVAIIETNTLITTTRMRSIFLLADPSLELEVWAESMTPKKSLRWHFYHSRAHK